MCKIFLCHGDKSFFTNKLPLYIYYTQSCEIEINNGKQESTFGPTKLSLLRAMGM